MELFRRSANPCNIIIFVVPFFIAGSENITKGVVVTTDPDRVSVHP